MWTMKLRAYKRVMNGLAAVEKAIVAILLAGEVALTAANVFSRYVIHQSWSFTEEVVVAVLVMMSMLGASLCARDRGGLINLTLVTDKLPKKVRLIVEIAMTVCLVVFALVMLRYGIVRCLDQMHAGRVTSALQLPEWYFTSAVPLGGALITIHSVERILDCIFEMVDDKGKEAVAE